MSDLSGFGKLLMVVGAVLFVLGFLFLVGDRVPFLGRLPGDIFVRSKGFSFYFPVVTCIALSLLITLILNLISRR